MKSVIVKVQIQFDIFVDVSASESDMREEVQQTLDSINSVLQERNMESQPQIFANNIDDDDIEISDEEIETFSSIEDCIESNLHLTDCDDDGFCNFCGNQDGGEYEEKSYYCPICGETEIESYERDYDTVGAPMIFQCKDCKAKGHEEYFIDK